MPGRSLIENNFHLSNWEINGIIAGNIMVWNKAASSSAGKSIPLLYQWVRVPIMEDIPNSIIYFVRSPQILLTFIYGSYIMYSALHFCADI